MSNRIAETEIAGRRRILGLLFERDRNFRALFERTADPTLIYDGDIYIDCNRAAMDAFGCADENSLIGLHPWDCSPEYQPDGQPSLLKSRKLTDIALCKGTNRFEWVHRRFDGQEFFVDVSLTILSLEDVPLIYTVFQDISKRRQAEEALKKAEEKYRGIFENAVEGILQATPDGRFLSANPYLARMYGYETPEELIEAVNDIPAQLYVDPGARAHFLEILERQGHLEGYETERRRKDGSRIWVSANARVVKDSQGKTLYLEGTLQDITDRKRTEAALRESEERYRIAIEHSNDGVAIIRQNKHLFVNRRLLTMFGYDDANEILGKEIDVTVHPDDYERVMEINKENKKEDAMPLRYDFKGVRRDGTTLHVEVSSTRITYQGRPAVLAYLRDITGRVHAEEMLRQAQKMEAIGTLSAGIAHDFNNILTAILGFTDLSLDEEPGSTRIKRYLLHVLHAAQRGKDLVNQILSFSRKGNEIQEPIDAAAVVKDSIRMLRASLPRTIEILSDIQATKPAVVFGNATQIQQIIMNLGMNAAQAMGYGTGILKIDVASVTVTSGNLPVPEPHPGDYVKLSVADTGCGMEKEVLERLFDPFFTTKRPGEGTGLGLWVVHSIIRGHNGVVTVASTPGEGSVFNIFLPRIENRPAKRHRHGVANLGGKGHVLVIDDETEIAELEKTMLERLGFTATTVHESNAALSLFKKNPAGYDLVLTDETMPEMTGLALARELIAIRPDVPIVLITGYRNMVDTAALQESGIKVVIAKPLTTKELGLAIKPLFEGRQ